MSRATLEPGDCRDARVAEAEKQAAYEAKRRAWAGAEKHVEETPGQEFWPIFRKPAPQS